MAATDLKQVDLESPSAKRNLVPRWVYSNVTAAVGLTAAGAFAFVTTWVLLSPAVENIDRDILAGMIVANVVIAVSFMALISVRLWHVWSDRRNQLAGSRTQMQLVGFFSVVAVVPAVLAFLFAFTSLRTSLNDVFSNRIDNYQETARAVADAFVNDAANDLRDEMAAAAVDIRRNEEAGAGINAAPISFRRYLEIQARARNFSALHLLDGKKQYLAKIELMPGSYNLPTAEVFREADNFKPGERFSIGANNDEMLDMYRGMVKISDYDGGYLIAYKLIDRSVAERLLAVRAMSTDWEEAKQGRSRLERVFVASYILLAIIILFGAIWLALWAATRIVQPIGRLIGMSEKVSGGDLGARVDVQKSDGELGVLARSMNHMTAQLQTQRNDLIETNRQFDSRRRFTEAVLSGVSAGVIGVSQERRITINNSSAADLIGVDAARLNGAEFSDVLPELEELFQDALEYHGVEVSDQIVLEREGRLKTLNVRIASDETGGERSFVVTFDDITQLVAAQRSAAWGDVARRIAHEIKNPLTPIQLSAERLRRKYTDEIKSSPEVFDKCTDTIIRHVNDIGRMVDEFSSFARMPKPVIAREDVYELVKAAVFPQRVAFPDIEFTTEGPNETVYAQCDGRLIVQALSNIMKNAGESIGARIAASEEGVGKILVSLKRDGDEARIDIIDNGVGLPKAERHRLTEPYMTTRAKGTGLGLAIVKKVIEEHGGALTFTDDNRLGVTGARMSIVLPLDGAAINETRSATAAAAE